LIGDEEVKEQVIMNQKIRVKQEEQQKNRKGKMVI
jgi:hypothetical protein